MRGLSMLFTVVLGLGLVVLASMSACSSGTPNGGFFNNSSSGGGSSGGSGGSGSGGDDGGFGNFGDAGGGSGSSSGGNTVCPPNLQCNVPCQNGGTTSIKGVVYDPAGKNPLYNVAVYVPAVPLQALPKGVPTGSDACSCAALFKSGAIQSTTTKVDGSFQLDNVPIGVNGGTVPLVIQIGKWRRQYDLNITACSPNQQPSKSLMLPGTVSKPNDSMPDIAVSTGSADTLECLMTRIGLPSSEYVAGNGGTGHVHIFSGGNPGGGGGGGGGGAGRPENPGMAGAPESDTTLWDSVAHMMPYDILLLSCEGGETFNANPALLETYLNQGGRAFGSHFHYSWFSGPIGSGQSYTAPADWGTNLASWSAGSGGFGGQANGKIVQTLNGSTKPFPKGVALFQWLGLNGSLGVNGAPPQELPIQQPRFNAVVGPANKPSQPWINDDATPNTMFFSFDTPVNAPPAPDGGAPNYCGRAVFSDLHVGGGSSDTGSPPGGCANADLSPQEKALEFMLFDLSSCVLSDQVPPPDAGIPAQ